MGNLNCLPLRRTVSQWFKSRDNSLRKGRFVIVAEFDRNDEESGRRILEIKHRLNVKDCGDELGNKNEAADGKSELAHDAVSQTNEERVIVNGQIIPLLNLDNDDDEIGRSSESIFKANADKEKDNADDDGEEDNKESPINSDTSLSSFGVCAFEDEIEDPIEASLFADGIDDVSLYTRDLIDVMVAFKKRPWVKAIERIKAYHASLKWRKDPIPEEERRGSIRDLSSSRHMRQVEKQVQGEAGIGTSEMAGLPQTTYVSTGNRRFSKSTDTTISDEDEEKEQEDDGLLTPRLQLRTHGFMDLTDDTVAMETERRAGGGMIHRHASYFNLPNVD